MHTEGGRNEVEIESVEPPSYRQDMIDKWGAWLDAFGVAFQRETGIVHYQVWPELDVILFSIHRRGSEPEAAATKWANICLAKQRAKEGSMKSSWWLAIGIGVVVSAALFALGHLLAAAMAIAGRISRRERMIPGEHEHLRRE